MAQMLERLGMTFDFRVVKPGAFVRCAVTGVAIPLEELKYWNVEKQEAYASPSVATAVA